MGRGWRPGLRAAPPALPLPGLQCPVPTSGPFRSLPLGPRVLRRAGRCQPLCCLRHALGSILHTSSLFGPGHGPGGMAALCLLSVRLPEAFGPAGRSEAGTEASGPELGSPGSTGKGGRLRQGAGRAPLSPSRPCSMLDGSSLHGWLVLLLRGAKDFAGGLMGSRSASTSVPRGRSVWNGPVFVCALGKGRVSHICRILCVRWVGASSDRPVN